VALSHLVDTSVLTRLRHEPVRVVVEPLSAVGALARSGITDLEIGSSARSAEEWDQAADALEAFELIETSADHLRRARQVQRLLASKHQRGRKVPDLLVAAAAEANDLVVLHYDADFDRIAAVTGQPVEWVVPAGSVD
jgi:predicted nucleic acid-binding protein